MSSGARSVECSLCPVECKLAEYERGDCGVRINVRGKLWSLVYGRPCAAGVDPIEKKPMYHMLPGTGAFSIATAGCCLKCKFCQNWQISQARPEDSRIIDLPPERVVALARARGCRSVAYTYTEPTVFYEYMIDTCRLARAAGLRNVYVTCGYINLEPLKELCAVMDGANVDLKAFSDDFYRKVCGGRLKPVLDALVQMKAAGLLVEVTNLVVPGLNDSESMLRKLVRWVVKKLGADTPIHFSRFWPHYKLEHLPPTPVKTLLLADRIAAEEGARYVYLGNVETGKGNNTYCPRCRKLLIRRRGFWVQENRLRGGKCPCGQTIAGIWS